METIQYSLKTNAKYSIDLKSTIRIKDKDSSFKKHVDIKPKPKPKSKQESGSKTNFFDKHCIDTYGKKTCILFELENDDIEIRLLDNIYQLRYTKKNNLYIIIPSLLEKLYTVILVEQISKTNTKEIVAIHSPCK